MASTAAVIRIDQSSIFFSNIGGTITYDNTSTITSYTVPVDKRLVGKTIMGSAIATYYTFGYYDALHSTFVSLGTTDSAGTKTGGTETAPTVVMPAGTILKASGNGFSNPYMVFTGFLEDDV